MNRKGFAISGLVYGILIIFLILIFSVLGILVGRSSGLNKIKTDALNTVLGKTSVTNLSSSNLIADFTTMYVNSNVSLLGVDYLNIGVKSPSGLTISNETNFVLGNPENEYNITFKALNSNDVIIDSVTKKIVEKNDLSKSFDFTGNKQELVIGPGIYKLEVWGAESGNDVTTNKGSYASGYLVSTTASKLYIYVGGIGTDKLASTTARTPGGYNNDIYCYNGSSGGGSTDIRINNDSLYSRVITANGGDGTCGNGGSLLNIQPGYVWSQATKDEVNSILSSWLLTENNYLINTSVNAKTDTFTSPTGTNETGHSGNGYAKITYIVSFE